MPAKKDAAISLLREQLQDARELLEGTMAHVTQQEAEWSPPGLATPLGATYAHIVISEDGTVNGLLKGAAPLFASNWAGKVGVANSRLWRSPIRPAFQIGAVGVAE